MSVQNEFLFQRLPLNYTFNLYRAVIGDLNLCTLVLQARV
jgi:hypothetical protein